MFQTYFRMNPNCPRCAYLFEREEGYWVGAMVVNLAFVEAWFAFLFAAIVIATAPDVAWMPLLVVAVVTNGIMPVICYPFSKTTWMAVDLYLHPVERAEGDNP